MTAAADTTFEPSGGLRAWLVQYDLLDTWVQANGLPMPRADYYRRELLRLYVIETRRAARSTARALFKGRV